MKNNFIKNGFLHPKFIPTWFILAIMHLLVFVPFRLQVILSRPIGIFLRLVAFKKHQIAQININKCFPDLNKKEQKKIVNQHFTDFAMSLFEVANCFYMNPKRLKKLYKLKNLDLLQKHIKNKENIILVVGHFTTMIIAGRILADNIYFADIYRPQNNKLFNFVMIKRFEKYGIKMIEAKNSREIIKTLKSNIPIWYAPDQDFRIKTSVFADFFKIKTDTITATSKLAKSSNAKVIHFSFYRHKAGYNGDFIEIKNYPSYDDLKDANLINKHLEAQIANAKSQYLWTHKRFKTRPNGEKSFYN